MLVRDLLDKVAKDNPDHDLSFSEFVQLYDKFIEYDLEDFDDEAVGWKVWVYSEDED